MLIGMGAGWDFAKRAAPCLTPRRVPLLQRGAGRWKRAIDVCACLLLLPPALLVIAFCAVLIRLEGPGPVVFGQWRTGLAGRRFRMYKLRTMRSDAERLKAQYAGLNQRKWPDFKIEADPRVTRVGHWLRRTSLDELPQVFNVLKGEMSLVGPRPTSFDVSTYSLPNTERLEVLPGITGLWQVSGRADLDFDRRVKLDVEYIERQSIWLDFCILARTLSAVVRQQGAY